MSPERTRDSATADHRSDLHGLEATLYALLTRRAPVEGDSLPQLIQQVRELEPTRPEEYQLSIEDRFEDVVMQLLAKKGKWRSFQRCRNFDGRGNSIRC